MTAPTLTEFLLARIAEDEAAARRYPDLGWERDVWELHYSWDRDYNEPNDVAIAPERVLADCEAKRRIVGYRGAIGLPTDGSVPNGEGMTYLDGAHAAVAAERERIMRLLALPYADHPDYRDEWKP